MAETAQYKIVKSWRKEILIEKARLQHGVVLPTEPYKGLYDGFREENDRLMFWYNDSDGSTHIVEETVL